MWKNNKRDRAEKERDYQVNEQRMGTEGRQMGEIQTKIKTQDKKRQIKRVTR